MTQSRRILITGSRKWLGYNRLYAALAAEVGGHDIIVHGANPTGADAFADVWAKSHSRQVETHPANWAKGKSAGPARNQEMVNLGADLCIAFIDRESRGTRDCARRAEKAGIPVLRIETR